MPEEKKDNTKEEKPEPAPKKRLVTKRRMGIWLGVAASAAILAAIVLVGLYKTGTIDAYIKGQFVAAFDEMGIEFTAETFTVQASPLVMRLENAVFTNKKTGEVIATAREARFSMTILDLFALTTERNINIDSSEIYGLNVFLKFDENGRSNFDGVDFSLPPGRVRFRYASARVTVRDSAFIFNDTKREISGDAEDLAIELSPDERTVEGSDINYRFDLSTTKAEFSYGGEEVEPIAIRGIGNLTELGIDLDSLALVSPLGRSTLRGSIVGWDRFKYDLTIVSDVDLTQASRVFPLGTAVSGTGAFQGRVTGEGEKYRIEGEVTSESLAASNVRLKALQINAVADGEGSAYRATGKAIAELLTFEDFRLDYPQIMGTIRGTGTDFRWLGALEAAALSSPLGTVGSLYINDAAAEYRDRALLANLNGVRAAKFSSTEAYLESIQTPSIRIISTDDLTTALADTATAARIDAEGATLRSVDINGIEIRSRRNNTEIDARDVRVDRVDTNDANLSDVTANDIKVFNRDGRTSVAAGRINAERASAAGADIRRAEAENVEVDTYGDTSNVVIPRLRLAAVETDSAILANLNVAGVRLTIRQGVITGRTDDFAPGTVDLKENGRLENVAVYRPVFVLEPSGRYRASLDMTLGGGLLGSIDLGNARATVVADNDKILLNGVEAEVMNGRLNGDAVVAMKDSSRSGINADFSDLDIGKLIAVASGNVVPIEGDTSGRADLTFAGTDIRRATGTLSATVAATAGNTDRGFLPVSGELRASADDGLVTFDSARLTSGATDLLATGRLDLFETDSDLAISIDSTDASEIERVIRIFELSPQLREQMDAFDGHLADDFTFRGNLTGNVEDPSVKGRAELESLIAGGRILGSLAANFNIDSQITKITDGILREPGEGGRMTFDVTIPSYGTNNTSVQARLENFNIGTLLTAVPIRSLPNSLKDLQASTSGELDLTGLPNNMQGSATLNSGVGTLNGQTFDSLRTAVSFDGTLVNIEEFEARFGDGILTANGFYRTDSESFIAQVKGREVPATRVLAFFPKNSAVPDAEGTLDIDLTAEGTVNDTSSYEIEFNGTGQGIIVNNNSFGAVTFSGNTVDSVLTARLVTNVGGSEQIVNATADLGRPEVPFRAETNLTGTPLGPFIAIFRKPDPDQVTLDGSATGRIVFAGDLVSRDADGNEVFSTENLRGNAALTEFQLVIGETPLVASETVNFTFSTNEVTVDNARFSGGGTNLTVNGTKALSAKGVNNLAMNGRIDLRVLNAISPDLFFAGIADMQVTLAGPNNTARLNGRAELHRGSFSTFVGSERVSLNDLNGCVLFNTRQALIGCNDGTAGSERITGSLGGGRVTLSGEAVLTDNLLLEAFRVDIQGTNITAPFPTGFTTTGNADLAITGRRTGSEFNSLITGTIFARRSVYTRDIDIADFVSGRREASLATGSGSSSILSDARLDIRILGRDALVVRNNIADLTASADLRVTGDVESPQIAGRISANEGTVFFRDDRYELQRGTLTFPPNSNGDPVINISAESEIRGYQIFVTLNGPLADADSLSATLRSNPSLPQADVISLITTGSLANTGSGIPTYAQSGLNTAAEILADEIINKPVARATDRLFGLNRFNLDPIVSGQRGNPTARLTVGRQINRNLLVTYATNLSQDQNQVLALEYRVSNRLSFVAQYEQRSIANVTRQRNAFSFEIRLRTRF
ncbi:MAG: translocation/assembly module TamB domain-containing protein [Acidobacteriota bacterium]|nr:MAG: translocation/assembly module TamB domain-containing protein [Acidobacteriota bacterium]